MNSLVCERANPIPNFTEAVTSLRPKKEWSNLRLQMAGKKADDKADAKAYILLLKNGARAPEAHELASFQIIPHQKFLRRNSTSV
jgi:hypothetical protein